MKTLNGINHGEDQSEIVKIENNVYVYDKNFPGGGQGW